MPLSVRYRTLGHLFQLRPRLSRHPSFSRKCLAAGPCSPKEAERAWRYAILAIQTKQRNPSAGQRVLLFYSTVLCPTDSALRSPVVS